MGKEIPNHVENRVCEKGYRGKPLTDEQMPSAVVGRIIKDGTNFILKATVNEGKEIYATGSQRFPRHYGDFRDRLREILNNK